MICFVPNGHILVNPSRDTREYTIAGRRYFITTGYPDIQSIPGLKAYALYEDKYWFRTQGLSIFGASQI